MSLKKGISLSFLPFPKPFFFTPVTRLNRRRFELQPGNLPAAQHPPFQLTAQGTISRVAGEIHVFARIVHQAVRHDPKHRRSWLSRRVPSVPARSGAARSGRRCKRRSRSRPRYSRVLRWGKRQCDSKYSRRFIIDAGTLAAARSKSGGSIMSSGRYIAWYRAGAYQSGRGFSRPTYKPSQRISRSSPASSSPGSIRAKRSQCSRRGRPRSGPPWPWSGS